MKLAVAVLGDDEVARRRISDLLEEQGLDVCAEGATLDELPRDRPSVDAVVVSEPESRPAAAKQIQAIRHELPDVRVLLVATDDGHGAVPSALRAGASGFVPFHSIERALTPSVRAAVAGQVSVPEGRRSQLDKQALTTREKQTLALVVMGLTNGEIATKLFLAESTVKSHLSSTFSKLGVRSRNEAAAMILDPNSGVGPGILTIPTEGP
jgi:DNA-binding NarL/FixJ family response regulator